MIKHTAVKIVENAALEACPDGKDNLKTNQEVIIINRYIYKFITHLACLTALSFP